MKKLLLFSLMFVVFSCGTNKDSQNNEKELLANKKDYISFLESLRNKVQTFQISSSGDTIIKGKFGVIVEIDSEDLETMDGSGLGKKIEIELIEIKDKKDFILYGVPTVSDKKMLISDGAFYLNMKSDSKELKIKEGKRVKVKLPANSNKDMQLFYGENNKDDEFNWKPTKEKLVPQENNTETEQTSMNKVDYEEDTVGLVADDEFNLRPTTKLGQQRPDSTSTSSPPMYEMQLKKFGWINCDRFLGEDSPQTSISINLDDKLRDKTANYLVFKSINSVMFSWSKNSFVNIPIGEEVELLSISKDEDKIFVYQKVFKVKKNETITLEMKEVSKDKLKEILDKF